MMLVEYRQAAEEVVHYRAEAPGLRTNTIAKGLPHTIRSAMDIEPALMHFINHRTGGRVRSLQVQILGGRVALRGWASSFYAVQLALAGLLQAFHEWHLDRPEEVELDIDVVTDIPTEHLNTHFPPERSANVP
jgi:hypothetical protein